MLKRYGKLRLHFVEKRLYRLRLSSRAVQNLSVLDGIFDGQRIVGKESKSCPGINRGKLWTKDEITAARTAYENNEPLKFKRGGEH